MGVNFKVAGYSASNSLVKATLKCGGKLSKEEQV